MFNKKTDKDFYHLGFCEMVNLTLEELAEVLLFLNGLSVPELHEALILTSFLEQLHTLLS